MRLNLASGSLVYCVLFVMMSTNVEKNLAVSEETHVLTAYGFFLVVSLASSMQITSFWNPFSKIKLQTFNVSNHVCDCGAVVWIHDKCTAPPASNSVYGSEKLFWYDKINFSNHVCHCGAVVKELLARADKPGSTPGDAVFCFFVPFFFVNTIFLFAFFSLFLLLNLLVMHLDQYIFLSF